MQHPRVWLITGASSGFGLAVAEVALREGEIVVAVARSLPALAALRDAHNTDKLLVLKCDVSNYEDVNHVFQRTIDQFGRCDVVFNNAGGGIFAEVEGTPDDVARAMFDVNFWGAAAVSREAVRVFRDVNPNGVGGRLLNNTSISGLIAMPSAGYYAARQHALEGLTKTLVQELDPEWNIKVSIIAPSPFKTQGTANSIKVPVHDAYHKSTLASAQARAYLAALEAKTIPAGDVKRAAEKIFEFSKLENPPLRWALGMPSVAAAKAEAETILKETEDFAGWSEGLEEEWECVEDNSQVTIEK